MPTCLKLIGRATIGYAVHKTMFYNYLIKLIKNYIIETNIRKGTFLATEKRINNVQSKMRKNGEKIGLAIKEYNFVISYYTVEVNNGLLIKINHTEGEFIDEEGYWVRFYSLWQNDNVEKCKSIWYRNLIDLFYNQDEKKDKRKTKIFSELVY